MRRGPFPVVPKRRLGTTEKTAVIAEFFVALAAGNVRDLRRMAGLTSRRSHDPLAREVADIFIPLTRNENSAMTVGGGDSIPDQRGDGGIRQAELGNDRKIPE